MSILRYTKQSFMLSLAIHIIFLIILSLFLHFSKMPRIESIEASITVQLMEERKLVPRPPKEAVKPVISPKKALSPLVQSLETSSKTPRGFLVTKNPPKQDDIGEAISQVGQGMRELQIGTEVSVKSGESIFGGDRKGEEILPTTGVERGLEVGKGDVGLADGVGELDKDRGDLNLEITKVERLKPVILQKEKLGKRAGLSMLDDIGVADADDILANVAKDMILDRTGFGVPKLPKGEPGGIVIGRGKDIRGYLRFPRVNCSMVDRNLVERFYSLVIPNLMKWVNANTNIKVDMNVEGSSIQLADVKLFDSPVIFLLGYDNIAAGGIEASTGKVQMTGWKPSPGIPPPRASSRLTDTERKRLREYLVEEGGILVVDTGSRINMLSKEEYPWSRKMRKELRAILPEYPMKRIENDHELYHSYYALGGPPPGLSVSEHSFAFARQP
ncbi:TPA: DUF4159 domain-containing protein [Candidatus Poribacteria bacterium]|nr:DUF4159 domain-containing protein [Candidatus Poribacteria bacterium]